jgi:hypothetical protein
VGVTAGSRVVPGRKPMTRDDDDDDNNNNNNNNTYSVAIIIIIIVSCQCFLPGIIIIIIIIQWVFIQVPAEQHKCQILSQNEGTNKKL